MGFKKDDSSRIPKSSFKNYLVVFLPVSTKRGTVQVVCFFLLKFLNTTFLSLKYIYRNIMLLIL
jgi:hypothetical protein